MGFPDTFRITVSDTQAYRQFGNSVAVPVIREVARIMVPHVLAISKGFSYAHDFDWMECNYEGESLCVSSPRLIKDTGEEVEKLPCRWSGSTSYFFDRIPYEDRATIGAVFEFEEKDDEIFDFIQELKKKV